MFKIKYFAALPIALLLMSCSGSDDDGVSTLEATVTSSNDTPLYNETYTITGNQMPVSAMQTQLQVHGLVSWRLLEAKILLLKEEEQQIMEFSAEKV
jgi:hypothetical protein